MCIYTRKMDVSGIPEKAQQTRERYY